MRTQNGRFSNLSERYLVLFLTLLFAGGLYAYFLPGDLLGLDTHSHLGRTWLFRDIIVEEGSFPIWTNRWYFGYPIGLYYGFLYYLSSGLFSIVTYTDVVTSTKFFLWGVHLCSGICMFYYIRYLTGSITSAIFASIFYVFSFQHLGTILKGGRLPVSLIYLFLPMIFYSLEHFERTRISIHKAAPVSALLLALPLFTHLQYGVYCLLTFGVVTLCRMALKFFIEKDLSESKRILFYLVMTGVFYSLFTAWILLPALQDRGELVLSSSNTIKDLFGKFSVKNSHEVVKQALGVGSHKTGSIFYMGLFPLLISLFAWKQKRYATDFCSYLFMTVVGLVLVLRMPRFANVWFFFACIFSAYGVVGINTMFQNRSMKATRYLTPLLFILLVLDLGSTLIFKNFRTFDNVKIREIQNEMANSGEIGRILVLNKTRSTLWRSLDVVGTNASSPFGGIPQASTKTHPFAAAIASKASMEVFENESTLSEPTLSMLGLLNINSVWIPKKNVLIRVPHASPVWFGTQLVAVDWKRDRLENATWASIRNKFDRRALDYSSIENVVAEMQLNATNHTLGTIIAHDTIEKPVIANPEPLTSLSESPFTLVNFEERHQKVMMKYASVENGFVLLPYSFFPHNKIKIDGSSVDTYKSAMNFTIVQVPKGEHTLTLNASISPLRKALSGIALLGLIITVVLLLIPQKRIYR